VQALVVTAAETHSLDAAKDVAMVVVAETVAEASEMISASADLMMALAEDLTISVADTAESVVALKCVAIVYLQTANFNSVKSNN